MLSAQEQFKIISSGADQIIPKKAMLEKLEKNKPLNIKLGVDPTAPDIHLGHAVPLRKLRQFQDLGHRVILIIGDGTSLIGDPSGRNTTRPQLSQEQIKANAQTYIDQAMKVLDPDKTKIEHNADWILSLDMKGLLKLCSSFTVARILERDDFNNRYKSNLPIGLHEFLYPVMQAYDSLMIKADVELGGTDQLFNLLAGRELMEKGGMEPQVCLTLPLLEGTDGHQKMSKSYGNYIGVSESADEQFGKVMSIPDELMSRYFRLASSVDVDKIEEIEEGLKNNTLHPNKVKRFLARNIVEIYHSENEALNAEKRFDKIFKRDDIPDEVPEFDGDILINDQGLIYLPKLLLDAKLINSISEGRRLIDGGGVKIDKKVLAAKLYNIDPSEVFNSTIQVGKRKFIHIPNK